MVNEYEEVSNFIDSKVIPESKYKQYHEMKWFKIIVNSEVLENYINSIKESVEQLKVAINNRVEDDKYNQASFYQKNIDEIKNEEVVTSLSKNSIIPKYGFPVDSVNLMVYDNGTLDRKLDLSRDLRIAISEYAPDSEIIVNGKKYTSKYISLPPDKHLSKYYYSTCPKCKRINVGLVPENVKKCSHCGMVNDNFIYKSFIIPSYGFKTGETKESTRLKPKKTYSGDVKYIGGGDIDDNKLYFSELLSVESSTNDELLVMNNSTFYTCPNCGYSIVDKSHYKVPKIANEHYDFKGMKCPNTILNITQIGHKFKTDVAHLYLSGISYNKALSFLYAMLEGISIEFNIERNDIDGLVYYNIDSNGYDLIIFDNVPGGAGHVKRIMDKDSLKNALITAKTKVSQDCCNENTSCYNCLRNYYNQKYHNRLKRKDALEVLELLLRSF